MTDPVEEDDEFPWSIEELSLPETWWLILQPAVNLTQVGDTRWNKVATRPHARTAQQLRIPEDLQ